MNTIEIKKNHIPIHAQIWCASDKHLFKFPTNDPSYCRVYYCEKSDSCPLLKRGQCINHFILSSKCPHGYVSQENGPTRRSKTCSQWGSKKREEYKNILGVVKTYPPQKMIEIGDWVYLPYAHLTMNEKVPTISHSALFVSGSPYIEKGQFTWNICKLIVDFHPYALMGGEIHPYALMGGEITSYQKEEIPKFLVHLEEVFPSIYKELMENNPHYIEKYSLNVKNYVGRMALLITTNPHEIKIDNHVFNWDGNKLTSLIFKPMGISVTDANGKLAIEKIDVVVIPLETAVIKIESNSQVSEKTKFVD